MAGGGGGKCSTIRHIVELRRMLRRWRMRAASSSRGAAPPPDVPVGHVAVCVGSRQRRFVVPTTYLNQPVFKKLLVQAEEEYGFAHHGPLAIPCDESVFEEILYQMSSSSSSTTSSSSCCYSCRRRRAWHAESLAQLPLLHGFTEKSW